MQSGGMHYEKRLPLPTTPCQCESWSCTCSRGALHGIWVHPHEDISVCEVVETALARIIHELVRE